MDELIHTLLYSEEESLPHVEVAGHFIFGYYDDGGYNSLVGLWGYFLRPSIED